MSAVKRVQKLLQQAEKRNVQAVAAQVKQSRRKQGRGGKGKGDETEEVAARLAESKRAGAEAEAREVVLIKGTGRAIAKALEVGLWFQQREEFGIQIRTGSVGAVDDIVEKDEDGQLTEGDGEDKMELYKDAEIADNDHKDGDEQEEEVPESRIRYTSVVEIGVSLVR